MLTAALFTRKDGIQTFGSRLGTRGDGRNPLAGRGLTGGRPANWHSVLKSNRYNVCILPLVLIQDDRQLDAEDEQNLIV